MDNQDDPFLLNYQPAELRIASEFLSTWLPFLSRDLCPSCTQILSHRVRSLNPEFKGDGEALCSGHRDLCTPNSTELHAINDNCDDSDTKSFDSGKNGEDPLGSWKDGANGWSECSPEVSTSDKAGYASPVLSTPGPRLSWADMAQEDELQAEEEDEVEELENKQLVNVNASTGELRISKAENPKLPREQREYIRFMNVKRKKDFICLERIKGKLVNILEGLELHTGILSAAEQKRVVDEVYMLQEKGRKGELRERTFTAPQKWMRGKGRETIQFGCCYNYAIDKNGNPPGILQRELVDPIPHLFKVIIRRLVRWHVLPPTCVPDSCIVNIYEEGDCIPPHVDNHDFVRPFCTVSFLSECDILFGSNLKVVAAGEFAGPIAIPLPVGSVLVLNGNGADVAKHCVPAVPTKRISITFRKMDESKHPIRFVPEPDLQGIKPYEVDSTKNLNTPKFPRHEVQRERNVEATNFAERTDSHSNPRSFYRNRRGPPNRYRTRVNLES